MTRKRLPPLNWLRAFEVSAKHLNFTQASYELSLTQAAVSHQVKGLEAYLGVLLFKRLPRGLELTQEGKAYIPVVSQAINKLIGATDELFGSNNSKPLIIKVNLVYFLNYLAPRLNDFITQYPEINLNIVSNIWSEDGEKDFHFDIRHGEGCWTDVYFDRITWDKLLPVCHPICVNGKEPPSSPNQLNNYQLLHVIGYRSGWQHWLDQSGFHHIDVSGGIRLDTLASAMRLAEVGVGIALGRSSLIHEAVKEGRLLIPFKQEIATNEAFYLISRPTTFENPDAITFRNWILSQVTNSDLKDLQC
ncbi:LysR substrate-binding domain-containing protein [Photobacterium leiognathi]|uniref:LysR substrate-binding domain-containing protein n=1 Tax=Photobacterium leiognathi TaxID=553611 RepID=UPI00273432FA|nr:LysR substrate-binding domain-containing protein [Photobacterium leiognathi]